METLIILSAIISIGSIICNILLLRANQKMYTEYFKDRSMNNRITNKEKS
jgi:hypothetical protein